MATTVLSLADNLRPCDCLCRALCVVADCSEVMIELILAMIKRNEFERFLLYVSLF